jgi:hypothetical protein
MKLGLPDLTGALRIGTKVTLHGKKSSNEVAVRDAEQQVEEFRRQGLHEV